MWKLNIGKWNLGGVGNLLRGSGRGMRQSGGCLGPGPGRGPGNGPGCPPGGGLGNGPGWPPGGGPPPPGGGRCRGGGLCGLSDAISAISPASP